jgi:hypothetical protein
MSRTDAQNGLDFHFKELVILGDFSIDYLNTDSFLKHYLIKTLLNLNLTQLV